MELVRNGRIGKLHAVRTGSPREDFPNEPEDVDAAAAGIGLRSVARPRPRWITSGSAYTLRTICWAAGAGCATSTIATA